MLALVLRPHLPRLVAGVLFARVTGRPAVFPGGPFALVHVPEPPLTPGRWVRVQSTLAGICGSDLKTLRLDISTRSASQAQRRPGGGPMFLGHETVGRVIEAGAGASLRPGQRVVMIPALHCAALERDPPCRSCAAGQYLLCLHRDEPAGPGPFAGGWSERFVRHESQLFPLPDTIDDEQAVLFDPLACAMRAVLRRPPAAGDPVLVVGSGTIGLGIVAVLRALRIDVDVTVLARHDVQVAAARRLGADAVVTPGAGDPYAALADRVGTTVVGHRRRNRLLADGFAVVYDAVGSAQTLQDGLRWARPGGAVVLEGVNQFPGVLDRTPIWHREIDVVGSLGHGRESWEGEDLPTFERLADWLERERLVLDGLVTHRFDLADGRDAVRAAADKRSSQAIKTVFRFDGS